MAGVTAIIGGQWGSEGKGVVAHALAGQFDAAVRVGGPNAGHSFVHGGRTYKMRGVPCAWVNPECQLFIGPGAVVDMDLLARELNELPARVHITVDGQAVAVSHRMAAEEKKRGMSEAIGSTTEGVGMARIAKIERDAMRKPLVRDLDGQFVHPRVHIDGDTSQRFADLLRDGASVMLEGTQGAGLSLHHGQWPFVTSSDTNVAGVLSEAGIAPGWLEHTYLVARTYPIRVGGNSGPMGDEIEWDELGVVPERTTVTNKQRRIARWSDEVFDRAVTLNYPCGVFLMFTDYLAPDLAGTTEPDVLMADSRVATLVQRVEQGWDVPVVGMGTGGEGWQIAFRGRCKHGEAVQA